MLALAVLIWVAVLARAGWMLVRTDRPRRAVGA